MWIPVTKSGIELCFSPAIQTWSFGCHAIAANNACAGMPSPPRIDSWCKGIEEVREKYSAIVRLPSGPNLTTQQYMGELSAAGWAPNQSPQFPDLSVEIQNQIFAYLATQLQGYSAVMFMPVVNYCRPSRHDNATDRTYITDLLIKYLMEHGGGSWWGLPVMRNRSHSAVYGNGASLFQPVVWYPNVEETSSIFRGTRFELHDKKYGKYGPLITPEGWEAAAKDQENFCTDLRGHARKINLSR